MRKWLENGLLLFFLAAVAGRDGSTPEEICPCQAEDSCQNDRHIFGRDELDIEKFGLISPCREVGEFPCCPREPPPPKEIKLTQQDLQDFSPAELAELGVVPEGTIGSSSLPRGTSQLMRQMDSMMNSMMQDPFASMMPMHHQMMSIQPPPQRHSVGSMVPFGGMPGFPMGMVDPFGMPSIGQMFQSFGQSGFGGGASPMYSSSSLMTMTTGPDGQPQVYQASTTTRTAPGGVREVQRSVSDSRSGVRKMAVGRHLGERGHVVEKEQNYFTGDTEEREDFINIEEEEAHQFDEEWNRRARIHQGMHGPSRVEMSRPHRQSNSSSYTGAPLAITAGPSHEVDAPRPRHSTHSRGLGPDRNARKRDGNRSGKSRHETSM